MLRFYFNKMPKTGRDPMYFCLELDKEFLLKFPGRKEIPGLYYVKSGEYLDFYEQYNFSPQTATRVVQKMKEHGIRKIHLVAVRVCSIENLSLWITTATREAEIELIPKLDPKS